MRVGVAGIEGHGVAIADQGVVVAAQIVVDVAEVEVRLEAVLVEADRALVERLRLDQLVLRVVNVGQVDDGRHELRIDHQRPPIGRRRVPHLPLVAVVQP